MMDLQSRAIKAEGLGRRAFTEHPDWSTAYADQEARLTFTSGLERDAFVAGFNQSKWSASR